jgi:hypothetical protein
MGDMAQRGLFDDESRGHREAIYSILIRWVTFFEHSYDFQTLF